MATMNALLSDPFVLQLLILAGIALGATLSVFGVTKVLTDKNPAASRMAPPRVGPGGNLMREATVEKKGLIASLVPDDEKERTEVQHALARAGFAGKNAVRNFYLLRLALGFGVPTLILVLIAVGRSEAAWVPDWVRNGFGDLSGLATVQILSILTAASFFGPSLWLKHIIAERKLKIEQAFPNALDLIQIAVEAGLGFDAAIGRVAREISTVAPDLAAELIQAQNEIQAGRDREKALLDMARRTGVDEVSSFVSVVMQSMQFGTPVSDALHTYSEEMRLTRELKAQEKANKLPVKMSAVMATLMLPAILILTVGPVVIRYINYFSS